MRRGSIRFLLLGVVLSMGCSSETAEPNDTQDSDLQDLPIAQDVVVDAFGDVAEDSVLTADLTPPDDLTPPTDLKSDEDAGEDTLDSLSTEDLGADVSSTLNDTSDISTLPDVSTEPTTDLGTDSVEAIVDVPDEVTDPGLEEPDTWLEELDGDASEADASTGSCDPNLCVSGDPDFSAACVEGVCQLSASEGSTTGSCTGPLPVPLSHDNPVIEVTVPANQLHSIVGLDACLASPGAGQYVLQFHANEGAIVALTNTNSVGGTEQFVLSVRDTCGSFGAGGFVVCSPQSVGLAGQLEGGSYFAVVNQWLGFGASIPFLQWSFTMRLELLDELPTSPDPSE